MGVGRAAAVGGGDRVMTECFSTERTARKTFVCSRCTQRIKPGTRYREHRLPPNSEIGNIGWWRLRNHLVCPPYPEVRW